MIQSIKEVTPIVGGVFIIFTGGVVWAVKQIYSFLNAEFVRKLECQKCMNKTKQEVLEDSNLKYHQVQKQIEDNHREWSHEIKEIRAEAAKRNEMLISMDTKLNMILKGIIKE